MANAIQSREYSKGGGTDGRRHVTASDGDPNIFNLKRNDDGNRWLNANYANPDNQWHLDNEMVFCLRKSLYFSPLFLLGEFCFESCPFHPPNIFPTSSSGPDRLIYFSLSKDLVSQSTCKSTLSVSVLRIACRTKGSFSWGVRKLAVVVASINSTNKVSILRPRVYR